MLNLKKLRELGLTKEEFATIVNKRCSCSSNLKNYSDSKEALHMYTENAFGAYCACVANVGYILKDTKLYEQFVKDCETHNIGCNEMRVYLRKYVNLKSSLMETE